MRYYFQDIGSHASRRNAQLTAQRLLPVAIALVALFSTLLKTCSASAAEPSGEKVYRSICARCHGANGEGGKTAKRRLEGDKSIAQLAILIAETMPEDDPGSLSKAESASVAAYIHESFYSPVARERNRPARIELARLTVRQFRNTLADLIGSFKKPNQWGEQRGLRAEYYSGRRFRPSAAAMQRVDAHVQFDFGTDSPAPGKIEPHEFSIRWNGSFLTPESGEYEFVVRTEHAGRLWVNDLDRPLIDAWVKSGSNSEYRATIFLLGGRVYPVRLEFSKAKQGVDDSKKQKTKPPPAKASIALLWKAPGRVLETIPSRCLSPEFATESYVCSTAFPPDDRSYGWERGTTISKAWDQSTTDAAIDVADYIAASLDVLAGVRSDSADRSQKIAAFCRTLAERAFRRPLSDEHARVFVDQPLASTKDSQAAVKRVVLLLLKSPRFLYRELGGGPDGFDVAARLSFGLWDSIPDDELRRLAAAGKLETTDQVARQAERLLKDQRARTKLQDFLLTWLRANHGLDISKDPNRFPGFDAAVVADLRTSLELMLDEIVWSEPSNFRQLLLADYMHLNGRLAKFYGADLPANADFTKVKLNPDKRAGVLTHAYLMASFAHSSESSPIHRGVFLARGVLGQSLRPPPEAVAPLAPDLHPSLTTRERVAMQTQSAACMTCHAIINPLGFTLEHFDAVGRYRDADRGKTIDATGSYRTLSGKSVTVNGARDLAAFLASSDEAQSAFVEQLFHFLVQQPLHPYGPTAIDDLRRSFVAENYNVRKLAVRVMAASALTGRATVRSHAAIPSP